MAFEDWGNDGEKTKHEKALAEDGARLWDEDHPIGYGSGLRVDIKAFLQETENSQEFLKKLDATERFVILAYYCLRKSEKQLAELVGLNECRFNMFLDNCTRKFTAIAGLWGKTQEDLDRILVLNHLGWFQCRPIPPEGKEHTQRTGERKLARTSEVLAQFQLTGSWRKTAIALGCYYVDLRRGIEAAGEELLKKPRIECELLASLMLSLTQFSSVREAGYAGRMGDLVGTTVRVRDQVICGSVIDLKLIDPSTEDNIFTPRALGAIKQGE